MSGNDHGERYLETLVTIEDRETVTLRINAHKFVFSLEEYCKFISTMAVTARRAAEIKLGRPITEGVKVN